MDKTYECTKTLLHENRHRIRDIRLEDVDDEGFVISALSGGLFPILESLKIIFRWTPDGGASFLLTNSMLRAPTMRRLSLRGCSVERLWILPQTFFSIYHFRHVSYCHGKVLAQGVIGDAQS